MSRPNSATSVEDDVVPVIQRAKSSLRSDAADLTQPQTSISQSINQSFNQSINQSITQPTNQPTNQSITTESV